MRPAARLRITFHLTDAAADWAGAALSDLFPDGVLLTPLHGGVVRLKGWMKPGPGREARARRRLAAMGAVRISAALQAPKPPKALHGRFPVLKLGRFAIVPAAQGSTARWPKGATPIVLVQGQAFGTGLHESTRLMLGEIERLEPAGQEILDIGAGSGILGFAALHLGAKRVTCVEMESAACAELRENRGYNAVAPGRLPVICGKYPLARLKARRYPLVLANLVTPVLLALMPALARQLLGHGRLLCSGIHTAAEAKAVAQAAKKAGLKPLKKVVLKDWHVLLFG